MEESSENNSAGSSKYSKKMVLLVALISFVLSGALFFAGGFYLKQSPVDTECVGCSEEVGGASQEQSQEDVEVTQEEQQADSQFYSIGPMIVNLLNSERFEYIQFSVTIRTMSVKLISSIEFHEPVLKHAFENVLRENGSETVVYSENLEKVTALIKSELTKVLEREGFDADLIEDLFLSDIIIE